MPSKRPRASFEPIPPDIDVNALVESSPNFQHVDWISRECFNQWNMEQFDRIIRKHVVLGGKPLIIKGYSELLDKDMFSAKWLAKNHGSKVETVRDLTKQTNMSMTIGHYLKHMDKLTEQFHEGPDGYKDLMAQRMYLKDIDCPPEWHEKLRDIIPPQLFYLNENITKKGGVVSSDEATNPEEDDDASAIAASGDLMSSLPPNMRAENLMCYIGHEGTYTPAHREMCASLGHNIMIEASAEQDDNGRPTRPGSSLWFMTEKNDRETVTEYWQSILGHNIEVENHFAQISAWQAAPLTVYVCQQRPGDFILIPPLAPHQVWNLGTRTMKVAWNRTTPETLILAMTVALPQARMVCRDEQYKNKAIIYYTLQRYSELIANLEAQQKQTPSKKEAEALVDSRHVRHLLRDFRWLFTRFKDILVSEMLALESQERINAQFLPFDSNVTCSFCRGNIFNRFLSCQNCKEALSSNEPEPYDVCMECYAMGRSCACVSKLKWVEQFKWKELAHKYEVWRQQVIRFPSKGPHKDVSQTLPQLLATEYSQCPTKTLAQVCQEQLKKRPFRDPSVPTPPEEEEDENSGDNETIPMDKKGNVKTAVKRKRRSAAWLKNRKACHFCQHRHEKWKMAECKCGRAYCYGTLFRGMDLLPLEILQQLQWECPHCKGHCNAGTCRKDPRQTPYEPKGTLLGLDTRQVADPRSVESLVDFRVSNLTFLRESASAPNSYARLLRHYREAQQAKQLGLFVTEDEDAAERMFSIDQAKDEQLSRIQYLPADPVSDSEESNNELIDPSLRPAKRTKTATRKATKTAAKQKKRKEVPAPDNDEHDVLQHDEAALQDQFVALAALMYQPPVTAEDGQLYEQDETIADALDAVMQLDYVNADGIKRTPVMRRKLTLPAGQLESARVEKQAIDAARREGRFIQVSAAMQGKKKLIKLKLGEKNTALINRKRGLLSAAPVLDEDGVQVLGSPTLTQSLFGLRTPVADASKQRDETKGNSGRWTRFFNKNHHLETPEPPEAFQADGAEIGVGDDQMAEALLNELSHVPSPPPTTATAITTVASSINPVHPILQEYIRESTSDTVETRNSKAPIAEPAVTETAPIPQAQATETTTLSAAMDDCGKNDVSTASTTPATATAQPVVEKPFASTDSHVPIATPSTSMQLPSSNGIIRAPPSDDDASDDEHQSIMQRKKGPGGRKVKIVSAAAKRRQNSALVA